MLILIFFFIFADGNSSAQQFNVFFMKDFLLIDSVLGRELYFDDYESFCYALYTCVCGHNKEIRVIPNDSRAFCVFEIIRFIKD